MSDDIDHWQEALDNDWDFNDVEDIKEINRLSVEASLAIKRAEKAEHQRDALLELLKALRIDFVGLPRHRIDKLIAEIEGDLPLPESPKP